MGSLGSQRDLVVLDLSGPPRELGRGQGEAARDQIAANVDVYLRRFESDAGLAPAEVLERGRRYLAAIERSTPEYAEMVRGLAEASRCDLASIAALNVRYEILYSEFARLVMSGAEPGWPGAGSTASAGAHGECSVFAVSPEASADGHLRLGQNWVWMPEVHCLLLRVVQPGGFRVLAFTEAGIAGGKFGLNSEGLGLAINGLVSNRDAWDRLHRPFHVRTWQALNCRRLTAAQEVLLNGARSCSANFLIAHAATGQMLDLEVGPDAARGLTPQNGVLVHTNHFLDADALGIWQPLDATSSSGERLQRLRLLLRTHQGHLDEARLTAVLADHDGYPVSICSHPSPLFQPDEQYATAFSALLDLDDRTILAAYGNPCSAPFVRYALAG